MHCTAGKSRRSGGGSTEVFATIVVVEDQTFVRGVTCEILRDAGYRVVQAECAAVARDLFSKRGQIHLLLCDAVLPDASGAVLAQSLQLEFPTLKVVLMSGYPSAGLPQPLGKKQAAGFLAKPYGAASLIAKVQAALRSGAHRVQIRGR